MFKKILIYTKNNISFILIILIIIFLSILNNFLKIIRDDYLYLICSIIILSSILFNRILFYINYVINIRSIIIKIRKNSILLFFDIIYSLGIIFCILFIILTYNQIYLKFYKNSLFLSFLIYLISFIITDRYQLWYKTKVYIFRKYTKYSDIKKIKNEFNKIIIEKNISNERIPIYYKNKEIDNYYNTIKNNLLEYKLFFE